MRTKKALWGFIGLFFFSLSWGQTDQFTVLYTNSSSGITYTGQGKTNQRVFSGINLPAEGKLFMKSGSWANFLYQEQKKRLEGPATIDLEELAQAIESEEKSTFMGRFWNFLSNSVNQTNDTPKLEKYHKEYLTNARGGISGYVSKKLAIQAPIYFSEIIGESFVQFQWDSISVQEGYTFMIESEENGQVIFKANTRNHHLSINLDELLIDETGVYSWKVAATLTDGKQVSSPTFLFSYAPQEVSSYMLDLQADDDYRDLEPFEQQLFLLQQLEEEGFYHSAYTQYRGLLEEEPENLLYKRLFAAFLARMNALDQAKSQLAE